MQACPPAMDDLTAGVLIQMLDDVNEFLRDPIVVHQVHHGFSVHTDKGLLKVHECYIERGLPFDGLLDDCRVVMWSILSWQIPACSGLNLLCRASFSLSRMTLVRTFLGTDRSMMPRQLPHWERSPFFGSFTRWPCFQSAGTRSCSQILFRRGCSISVCSTHRALCCASLVMVSRHFVFYLLTWIGILS